MDRRSNERADDPTPEQIAERAAEIRRGWDARAYAQRTVGGIKTPNTTAIRTVRAAGLCPASRPDFDE
jgi:hypothetical protein